MKNRIIFVSLWAGVFLYCFVAGYGAVAIFHRLTASPHVCNTSELVELRAMVERDDKIIDHMLGGTWDRSKNIRAEFGGESWGEVVWAYYQDGDYAGPVPTDLGPTIDKRIEWIRANSEAQEK